jgi:nucleotide-binding universal stress UspA family protein
MDVPADRVVLIAVDDSDDSAKAFNWALENVYREGDQLHLVHVVPRLAFAAQYGVPPVDFVPAAENNTYESAVQRAEQFIIDRFVKALTPTVKSPVVHIIKVRPCMTMAQQQQPVGMQLVLLWCCAILTLLAVQQYKVLVHALELEEHINSLQVVSCVAQTCTPCKEFPTNIANIPTILIACGQVLHG